MDWGPIFAAGLQGALQFGGNYFNQQAGYDQQKKDRAYQEAQNLLAFNQAKELKAEAPGAPAPFTGFTDPQKVQAIQNQDTQNQNAINAIITAYQRALLSR